MTKKEKADCRRIADHYGRKVESAKLIEEMGELKEAIEDWEVKEAKRADAINAGFPSADDDDARALVSKNLEIVTNEAIDAELHIFEEVADVEICIQHLKYLRHAKKDVAEYRRQKIARQLRRMEAGE